MLLPDEAPVVPATVASVVSGAPVTVVATTVVSVPTNVVAVVWASSKADPALPAGGSLPIEGPCWGALGSSASQETGGVTTKGLLVKFFG